MPPPEFSLDALARIEKHQEEAERLRWTASVAHMRHVPVLLGWVRHLAGREEHLLGCLRTALDVLAWDRDEDFTNALRSAWPDLGSVTAAMKDAARKILPELLAAPGGGDCLLGAVRAHNDELYAENRRLKAEMGQLRRLAAAEEAREQEARRDAQSAADRDRELGLHRRALAQAADDVLTGRRLPSWVPADSASVANYYLAAERFAAANTPQE